MNVMKELSGTMDGLSRLIKAFEDCAFKKYPLIDKV
jgi:hypothetical protein